MVLQSPRPGPRVRLGPKRAASAARLAPRSMRGTPHAARRGAARAKPGPVSPRLRHARAVPALGGDEGVPPDQHYVENHPRGPHVRGAGVVALAAGVQDLGRHVVFWSRGGVGVGRGGLRGWRLETGRSGLGRGGAGATLGAPGVNTNARSRLPAPAPQNPEFHHPPPPQTGPPRTGRRSPRVPTFDSAAARSSCLLYPKSQTLTSGRARPFMGCSRRLSSLMSRLDTPFWGGLENGVGAGLSGLGWD
jgi:hypothetical protein